MDRRTRNAFLLALGIVVVLAGGATLLRATQPISSSTAASLVGVVVGIDTAGLDQVRGFDVRTPEGATVTFAMGDLENGAEFPPGHLGEHQATAEPVRVFYREEGETKIAIRIDDAS